MISGKVEVDMSPAEGLKKSLVNRILRQAILKAGTPVKGAVKSTAQSIAKTGGLGKSIGHKVKTYADGVVMVIGPKSDYASTKGTITRGPKKGQPKRYVPARVAKIIEKGSKRSSPRPFLAPALARMQATYRDRLAQLIKEGIEQALNQSKS